MFFIQIPVSTVNNFFQGKFLNFYYAIFRVGEGAKRMCHYGKGTSFNVKKKVPTATKPRGGGLKALVAGPLKE